MFRNLLTDDVELYTSYLLDINHIFTNLKFETIKFCLFRFFIFEQKYKILIIPNSLPFDVFDYGHLDYIIESYNVKNIILPQSFLLDSKLKNIIENIENVNVENISLLEPVVNNFDKKTGNITICNDLNNYKTKDFIIFTKKKNLINFLIIENPIIDKHLFEIVYPYYDKIFLTNSVNFDDKILYNNKIEVINLDKIVSKKIIKIIGEIESESESEKENK